MNQHAVQEEETGIVGPIGIMTPSDEEIISLILQGELEIKRELYTFGKNEFSRFCTGKRV